MPAKNLENAIKKAFPALAKKSFKTLKSGYDHDVLLVNNKIIFRFPKSKQYQKLLAQEIPLLNYLAKKLSITIPNYSYVEPHYNFAGYPIISGKALSQRLLLKLNKKERRVLIKQIADFLNTLHQVPIKYLKKYGLNAEQNDKELTQFFKAIKKQVFPKLNSQEKLIVEKFIIDWEKHTTESVDICLTHHDLSGDNIFWDTKTKKLGIIDFSDRQITDPAHDFAACYEFGADFVKSIYKNYVNKKDTNLLKRAFIYYQKIALDLLLLNSQKTTADWKNAYKLFKQRFAK